MTAYTSILITGASSGLGTALALAYARAGVTLHLGGRDEARLRVVAEACDAQGAAVFIKPVDVTDAQAMGRWIAEAEAKAPLDLVIANAGISAGTSGGGETDAQVRAIFAANVDGVINTVMPAVPLMTARGRGTIAIMSSLAGFRGLPGAPAYCASKAAVRVWGEGLRAELAASGVSVSVICPGFVVTPMTAVNRFKMPFLMTASQAASVIKAGLEAGKGRIAFPWQMHLLIRVVACLPSALVDRLARWTPRK
jgi:short-subunit dehydrogenase